MDVAIPRVPPMSSRKLAFVSALVSATLSTPAARAVGASTTRSSHRFGTNPHARRLAESRARPRRFSAHSAKEAWKMPKASE